jgi:hypothetical protein
VQGGALVTIIKKSSNSRGLSGLPGVDGSLTGRATGILQFVLLCVSAVATFKGVSDFFGVTESSALSYTWLMAGVAVLILTAVMWYSIERVAIRTNSLLSRGFFLLLYLMMFIWSVGFGYGFWWGVFSSEATTDASTTAWVNALQSNIAQADGHIDAVLAQTLRMKSEALALEDRERQFGGTCGVPTGGTCGPFCKERGEITDSLTRISDGIKTSWLDRLTGSLATFGSRVRSDVESLKADSNLSRRESLNALQNTGNNLETNFNSLSQNSAAAFGAELTAIGNGLNVPPGQAGFTCYNTKQSASIAALVRAVDQPPVLQITHFHVAIGADATKFAILKLWRWALGGVWPNAFRDMQATGLEEDTASSGLHGNDFIALFVTILTDFSIFLVSLFKARTDFQNRTEIQEWIDAHFHGREADFVEWYTKYQFDSRGSKYLVRPTPYWVRKTRDKSLTMEDINVIAWPLLDRYLIKEIAPSTALLTLSQQLLQNRGWSVHAAEAPASVYRVTGNGLAQLFAIVSGKPAKFDTPFSVIGSVKARVFGSRKSVADRSPGS